MRQRSPLREQFETGRRREAFLAFLAGAGTGIIVSDTWISPWLGVPGGLALGSFAWLSIYAYETVMWRRHHGR